LAVASANARRLGIGNVAFVRADWYADVPAGSFDLIASNPPYIAAGDPHLAAGDLRFEPPGALTPGGDGLGPLRTIVAGAGSRLVPGGWLVVEHGYDQSQAVQRLFAGAGFGNVVALRDLAGVPRVVAGRAGVQVVERAGGAMTPA
jgi:release factor glutamine methyltransferase